MTINVALILAGVTFCAMGVLIGAFSAGVLRQGGRQSHAGQEYGLAAIALVLLGVGCLALVWLQ